MSMNPPFPARRALQRSTCSALTLALLLTTAALPSKAQTAARSPTAALGAKSRAPVTVNFVNADIEAVTRAFAAMIERQIAVDPRVKGAITVYSEQPQSIAQAYQSYLAALRGLGFAVVESGGLLKVVPEADAKLQTGTVSVGEIGVKGDQIITQIFQLRYENPNNLVAVLRPLISANNTINANPASSSLVITDYADNLRRIAQIIAALDQPTVTDVEVIPLQNAVASDLVQLVQRLADTGAGAGVPGVAAGGGGGTTVVADSRSNSLIVRAPNASRMAAIRTTISRLDRPSAGIGPGGGLWVVHLKNADAVKLATVLRAAFSPTGGGGGAGSSSSSSASSNLSAPANQPAGTPGQSSAASTPLSSSPQPSTGGFIQADPSTNSLIITAPEPLYRQVRTMIDQLDSRRAQVYIESMIVEVSGDNAADFGFQWQGLLGNKGDNTGLIGGTNFTPAGGAGNIIGVSTGAVSGTIALGEGLNLGILRNYGGTYALAALARALQSQTNTNIVSTPNLITLDNEEAKIVIGSNVPFVTGSFSNTGSTGGAVNPFQTIERRDVGITLRIRPQIGESGTVRMAIFQEVSTIIDKVAPGTTNAGPSTNKRLIESNVVVDDGGIIVIGGLIEDRFVDNKSQIPLLGDIPYLGALFRSQSRTKTRTNLMVFLRPVVLRDAASADKLSLDRYDLIRAQQKDSQPAQSIVMPINDAPVLPPMRDGTPIPTLPVAPIRGVLPLPADPAASEPPALKN